MTTKISQLKTAWLSGDKIRALKIAAKFPELGAQKEKITRAWAALQNPEFYREIGESPEKLIQIGLTAVSERYKLC